MRPIDADVVFAKLNKICVTDDVYGMGVAEGIAKAMSAILSTSTIEAEPVRHGYWENANGRPNTYIRKCSVCGKEAYFCGRGCSYKFCPNCGAMMDGDSDE